MRLSRLRAISSRCATRTGGWQVVGKRFNAFAAEQWLRADGDDRDPASARDPDARCDPAGCIAALPQGRLLSVVTDRSAFEEDCARAAVLVSALTAPADCKAQVFDKRRLALTGAAGLVWDGSRFLRRHGPLGRRRPPVVAAPKRAPNDRIVWPRSGGRPDADPADPSTSSEEAP